MLKYQCRKCGTMTNHNLLCKTCYSKDIIPIKRGQYGQYIPEPSRNKRMDAIKLASLFLLVLIIIAGVIYAVK